MSEGPWDPDSSFTAGGWKSSMCGPRCQQEHVGANASFLKPFLFFLTKLEVRLSSEMRMVEAALENMREEQHKFAV